MKSDIARQALLRAVQEQFSIKFPYLKIDFSRGGRDSLRADNGVNGRSKESEPAGQNPQQQEDTRVAATDILWNGFAVSGDMKVSELEVLLQYEFGLPARILRKSGNLWLETEMTNQWTLGQQNDHGRDIAMGFGA